ncbi:MAG: hypothetical protein EOL90_07865, partial [Spartobacteria bacterium]|nr:hypothetical protein [Spartobacteria bacterium]
PPRRLRADLCHEHAGVRGRRVGPGLRHPLRAGRVAGPDAGGQTGHGIFPEGGSRAAGDGFHRAGERRAFRGWPEKRLGGRRSGDGAVAGRVGRGARPRRRPPDRGGLASSCENLRSGQTTKREKPDPARSTPWPTTGPTVVRCRKIQDSRADPGCSGIGVPCAHFACFVVEIRNFRYSAGRGFGRS